MEISVSRNRAALAWLAQAITGLLLVMLLIVHLVANHFIVPGGLQTYQDVVNYLSNPAIFILEITFLMAVTGHALLGVRAILIDRGMTPAAKSRLDSRLWILGTAVVIYGLLLSIVIIT